MKKLFSLLMICSLFLFSCSQDNLLSSNDDSGASYAPVTTRGGLSPKYKQLGWGIDMTGNYLSFDAVKGPVIDVAKFESAPNQENRIISIPIQRTIVAKYFYGKNATEYTADMTSKLDISFGGSDAATRYEGKNPVFTNTISGSYEKKQSYSSAYTFVGYDKCITAGKCYFLETNPEILRNYLDDGFLYSLNHNTAQTVVNEYGTHVILNCTLGGRLSFIYKSMILKSTKEVIAKAGANYSFEKFGVNTNGSSIDTKLVEQNLSSSLRVQSFGGTKDISVSWDSKDGTLSSYSTTDWSNSVTFDTGIITEIKNVIPIYDLVADPIKRAELKIAVEDYIKKRQLELLEPLYHGFKSSKYNDTFGAGEVGLKYLEDYKYDIIGVECYVQRVRTEGTIPLYHGFKSSKYNDNFMAGPEGMQKLKDWGYDIIGIAGYIFAKQIPGTVPLYNGWKKSKYNNTLGAGDPGLNIFDKYGYRNIGLLGYVYPAETYWQ
ncbi:MAC/perforin domain-containing protein [uncultured Bacteroides sp.]|uniref:MAC/perforin domain-containing protein n=1 Tax=uncultured Bacteroides sp. TaxID=162156 RepID=UPI002AAB46E6|nr:MAC/perforin domain-containing protein [uncultured Bacteroides sp.]